MEIYKAEAESSPIESKLLLSVPETAKLLGVCERTVYKMRDTGRLKDVRIGSRVLFSPLELDAFISRQLKPAQ